MTESKENQPNFTLNAFYHTPLVKSLYTQRQGPSLMTVQLESNCTAPHGRPQDAKETHVSLRSP